MVLHLRSIEKLETMISLMTRYKQYMEKILLEWMLLYNYLTS